ncbi:hypothetical protein [Oceanobacillus jeddahense]|uniref:hypothetical protein n=1 Tax=Oceanobacillus jeddahense TaxID=1462527 RepID=UPI001B7D8E4E|nr:hypothetical protein [Oceanobacillus jeddahense]
MIVLSSGRDTISSKSTGCYFFHLLENPIRAEWLAGVGAIRCHSFKKADLIKSKDGNEEHAHPGMTRYICLLLSAKMEL